MAFCIDLFLNNKIIPLDRLEVTEIDGADLAEDLKYCKVKTLKELQPFDWDRLLFETEAEADKYLIRYREAFKRMLSVKSLCKSRDLPAMAYRRRYFPLALLGTKLVTCRDYRMKLFEGDLFNLHDRTYFLTVLLKRIEFKNGLYEYHFELP